MCAYLFGRVPAALRQGPRSAGLSVPYGRVRDVRSPTSVIVRVVIIVTEAVRNSRLRRLPSDRSREIRRIVLSRRLIVGLAKRQKHGIRHSEPRRRILWRPVEAVLLNRIVHRLRKLRLQLKGRNRHSIYKEQQVDAFPRPPE